MDGRFRMKSLTCFFLLSFVRALRLNSDPGVTFTKNVDTFSPVPQKCVTQAFADILFQKKIHFFPVFGTLLQLHRDGHLKESDNDVDLAIYAEHWPEIRDEGLQKIAAHECFNHFPKLKRILLDPPLRYFRLNNGTKLLRNFHVEGYGAMLDFWFLYKTSTGHRSMCSAISEKLTRAEEYPEFTNVRAEARPGIWNITLSLPPPREIEAVLETSYGPKWQTPVNHQKSNEVWNHQPHVKCADLFSEYVS